MEGEVIYKMSDSSLWVMNKKFNGKEIAEFSNSWLFAPVTFNTLLEKYIPRNPFEEKRDFILSSMFDDTLNKRLNEKINASTVQEDRILWEISNQQVFFTKDKDFITHSIRDFLKTNKDYTSDLGEHIHERFIGIADEIAKIDENEFPYFIFKDTSCDDNVEYWFYRYDEESGKHVCRSLNELDKNVTEFTIIENNIIKEFISNTSYFI